MLMPCQGKSITKTVFDKETTNLREKRSDNTVEPFLRGPPDEKPPPLEGPFGNVNLNINVLIFTSEEWPPLLNGHISGAKGVASIEGFHYL